MRWLRIPRCPGEIQRLALLWETTGVTFYRKRKNNVGPPNLGCTLRTVLGWRCFRQALSRRNRKGELSLGHVPSPEPSSEAACVLPLLNPDCLLGFITPARCPVHLYSSLMCALCSRFFCCRQGLRWTRCPCSPLSLFLA